MKSNLSGRYVCFALIAVFTLLSIPHASAQVFTTLYNFTNNGDGANPYGVPYGLVVSGKTFYGTATFGGSNDSGAVFAINSDGTGFTNLYSFTAVDPMSGTNTDGSEPNGLVLSGGTLYGTTYTGGTGGNGTVFALNISGSGFTNLHNFATVDTNTGDNVDGANPFAAVIVSGNALYGTAGNGGSSGYGTVFSLGTNGNNFTPLHSFSVPNGGVNSDGASPEEALVLSGTTLYGTTTYGGTNGNGVVFALNVGGGVVRNLYSFTALDAATGTTNSDGALPNGVILSGNMLYGTANIGGALGGGTVFGLNTNGGGFTNLHNFAATNNAGISTNGSYPFANPLLVGSNLYGVAGFGGSGANGTLFAVNTNGSGFTNLHNFTIGLSAGATNSDGGNPQGGLVVLGDALYGTAYGGGSAGFGTVFSVAFSPSLAIAASGSNVVLTWPANSAGFSYSAFALEATTNLGTNAAWNSVSPPPVVVNGLNTVTNTSAGSRLFYRLSQ